MGKKILSVKGDVAVLKTAKGSQSIRIEICRLGSFIMIMELYLSV